MGLQWKSWTGDHSDAAWHGVRRAVLQGTAQVEGSRAPIPVPEPVRPVIEAWRRLCRDPSPEALMFPTFGRGERKGEAVPREAKNFLEVAGPSDRSEAGDSGSPDHLPGDAALSGNPPAGTRNLEGHPGRATPCQHHDDGQCVRAGGRGKCDAGGQLSRHGCTGWMGASGGGLGLKGRNVKNRAGDNENRAVF